MRLLEIPIGEILVRDNKRVWNFGKLDTGQIVSLAGWRLWRFKRHLELIPANDVSFCSPRFILRQSEDYSQKIFPSTVGARLLKVQRDFLRRPWLHIASSYVAALYLFSVFFQNPRCANKAKITKLYLLRIRTLPFTRSTAQP